MATGEGGAKPGYVVPNPQAAKTLGILNVIFASLLLALSLISVATMFTMPMLNKAIAAQKAAAERDEAKAKAELADLEKKENAARTEDEKKEIATQRKALSLAASKRTAFGMPMDLSAMGMNDPAFLAYWYTDILTGVTLNAVMLATGIGLLMLKGWARTTWLWVAGIKIVRLFLVWGFFAIAVVPTLSQKLGKFVYGMMSQQQFGGRPAPAGMNEEFFTRVYGITYTVMAAIMVIFGVIYPAVSIWILNKPRVRAAFVPKSVLRSELA